MKKIVNIVFVTLFVLIVPTVYSQNYNNIGIDFGGFSIATPKKDLQGNKYNPYIDNSSSLVGIFYERSIGDLPYKIKSGFYLNKQFSSLISYQIPLEFSGSLIGKNASSKGVNFFYTGGMNINLLRTIVYGFRFPEENTTYDIVINKNSYISPYLGLLASYQLKKICFNLSSHFHYFIPEIVEYETTYILDNNKIVENNYNKNYGISFRIGLAYGF